MNASIIATLCKSLRSFEGRRIVVVGDVMLDRYVYGTVSRISPEAPVPVLLVEDEAGYAGGAANVAVNLARLGANVALVGVVGEDQYGQELIELLSRQNIDMSGIYVDSLRCTTIKQRLISRRHQMLRCDWETNGPLASSTRIKVLENAGRLLDGAEAVICSDYAKGLMERDVIEAVAEFGAKACVPTIVDPKAPTFNRYKGFRFVTPNEAEFSRAFGLTITDEDAIHEQICPQLALHGWRAIFVTRGEQGVSIVESGGMVHIPGHRVEVFDIIGAGDTFIATLALGLASGLPPTDAAAIANVAGSIVVTKAGTAYVEPYEIDRKFLQLKEAFGGNDKNGFTGTGQSTDSKILTLEQAQAFVATLKKAGKTIVFTNGCFDVLHPGHIHLLREARKLGDFLVVAVNSDSSVRALKGPSRPVSTEASRLQMLSAFPFVDLLLTFDEVTPMRAIEALSPEVLVKGGDYQKHEVVGGEYVESRGGRIVIVDLLPGHSSSQIVERVIASKSLP